MKKLTYIGKTKKGTFYIWGSESAIAAKKNGVDVTISASRTDRVYTLEKGKKDDTLEVDEKHLDPMIGEKGEVIPGFYWLKA